MKIKYIILAAAAISALSCVKEINSESNQESADARKVSIRVFTPENIDSKVSLTEASDRKSMHLAWELTDKLSVNGNEFTVSNILSDHEAEFSGNAPEGSSFTIIYPGKYADAAAFNGRSYAVQGPQSGNSSTAHLEYNAMLSGVSEYAEPKFDADWAADKGGSLKQNGAIQLRLQLPEGTTTASSVTLVASRAIFPSTNAGGENIKEQTLSLSEVTLPSNRILEAYMMFSAAGITWLDGDKLTVAVATENGLYYRSLNMTAQSWTGGMQYTIQCKVSTPNDVVINNASDLESFRNGVNSGDFLWQTASVSLGADIDCSGISSWTPIGNGSFTPVESGTVSAQWTEPAFKGSFDGKGFAIKNLKMTGSPASYYPYGLFGILYKATVKNLTLGAASGDTGALDATPVGRMDAGAVAGAAFGATVQDVTNYFPMNIPSNSSPNRVSMGMVGYVYGDTASGKTILSGLKNYGKLTATQSSSNSGNGATAVQVAGIAGFGNSGDTSIVNEISGCTNYGDIETATGRSAGILGAANTRTNLNGCVNRGNILNSFSNNRIGGVSALVSTGSSMTDCSNYGQVVTTQSNGQVAGLVCLINNASVSVSGGGNHGLVVGDITTYRGTLIANMNNFSSVNGLVAGGAVASYNGGEFEYPAVLTQENYMGYIGVIKSGFESKVTNISFEEWENYPAPNTTYISNAAQLLAFAAKVNDDNFGATEIAVLTNDIDCSGITEWTPIGNCGMTAWDHTNLTTSGYLFKGTFDGKGHSIKNLKLNLSSSGSWAAYGFFGGIGDGATVKNLSFDSSCSVTISASYGSVFGTLAGLVMGATISDIHNYASLSGGGTTSLGNNDTAGRTMVGAIIGEVHTGTVAASLTNLHNHADIGSSETAFSRGNNAGNGANGFHLGGIAGFSTNTNNTTLVSFTDCINDGNIYTDAGRSSGIVAAANRYTKLLTCINNGDVVSLANGTFRLGNITCIAAAGCVLDGCINYGDLIALDNNSVAGVICLINNANVQVTNCASLGATILGKAVQIPGPQNNPSNYNGVLFGYCNSNATVNNCRVSGTFGKSDSNKVTLDASNYFDYVGVIGTKCTTISNANISFASE